MHFHSGGNKLYGKIVLLLERWPQVSFILVLFFDIIIMHGIYLFVLKNVRVNMKMLLAFDAYSHIIVLTTY